MLAPYTSFMLRATLPLFRVMSPTRSCSCSLVAKMSSTRACLHISSLLRYGGAYSCSAMLPLSSSTKMTSFGGGVVLFVLLVLLSHSCSSPIRPSCNRRRAAPAPSATW